MNKSATIYYHFVHLDQMLEQKCQAFSQQVFLFIYSNITTRTTKEGHINWKYFLVATWICSWLFAWKLWNLFFLMLFIQLWISLIEKMTSETINSMHFWSSSCSQPKCHEENSPSLTDKSCPADSKGILPHSRHKWERLLRSSTMLKRTKSPRRI